MRFHCKRSILECKALAVQLGLTEEEQGDCFVAMDKLKRKLALHFTYMEVVTWQSIILFLTKFEATIALHTKLLPLQLENNCY